MAKKKVKKARKAVRKSPEKKVPLSRISVELEVERKELFYSDKSLLGWAKRYSPVIIMQVIGLSVYFFLVFYLFYPQAITQGHYVQLLTFLSFIFLVAGLLIYLGLKAELLFVRILSFTFVFVIFTLMMLFILVAYAMQAKL
jgi:hypothetical protein